MLQFGCEDAGFAGVEFLGGDFAFALGAQQLPPVRGATGFVDVTFTPATADAVTATIGIDPAKTATLKGAGKVP